MTKPFKRVWGGGISPFTAPLILLFGIAWLIERLVKGKQKPPKKTKRRKPSYDVKQRRKANKFVKELPEAVEQDGIMSFNMTISQDDKQVRVEVHDLEKTGKVAEATVSVDAGVKASAKKVAEAIKQIR